MNSFKVFSVVDAGVHKLLKELMKMNKNDNEDSKQVKKVFRIAA
jgi:hypothetical protein